VDRVPAELVTPVKLNNALESTALGVQVNERMLDEVMDALDTVPFPSDTVMVGRVVARENVAVQTHPTPLANSVGVKPVRAL